MVFVDAPVSVLLDKVYELIRQRVDPDDVEKVIDLAKIVFQNLETEDLNTRNDSDLYGAILSLWHQLSLVSSKESYVKVFNPEQKKHSWQSTHTIIEVIHPDMPFLVDSVDMALKRFGLTVHLLLNSPISLKRDAKKAIKELAYLGTNAKHKENLAVLWIEINRQSDTQITKKLENEIKKVLEDLNCVVQDWRPMVDAMDKSIRQLRKSRYPGSDEELDESIAFLKYLSQGGFTFLGYRRYEITKVDSQLILKGLANTGLGILKNDIFHSVNISELPTIGQDDALGKNLLVLNKMNSRSDIHRAESIDYIGIKRFNELGEVIGEDRFLGLYALGMYHTQVTQIPLIKSKVQRILDASGLYPGSHDYKSLLHILETFPRDELLQSKEKELIPMVNGVLKIQERDKLRVFMRRDHFGRYLSFMVYISKERFNTKLRKDTQRFLAAYFKTQEYVEFVTYFTDSTLARTHYVVRVDHTNMDIDVKEIENNLKEAARLWEDKFISALIHHFGEAKGRELATCYSQVFSRSYQEEVSPNTAVLDIEQCESLNAERTLSLLFYRPQEATADSGQVRLKLFSKDKPIILSDVMPVLENFGLRVINEHPYEVKSARGDFWISDFFMQITDIPNQALMDRQELFQDALYKVWNKTIEDDGFNSLVLSCGLSAREVSVLRAYARYMRQIESTFGQSYIVETFKRHSTLASLLVKIFKVKFELGLNDRSLTKYAEEAEALLDNVTSLDDDRIVRRYLGLIYATLRTNFFQRDQDGHEKSYISFKFSPELIPDMPLPLPKFEIFVYSPRIEGVHLRGGKVARGGLRWSDRRQDFRTEVLGLVKAQQVKNTVIVPVGAKGGFVCKQPPTSGKREDIAAEGQACYQIFIRGLLDITDNIIKGEIQPPDDVVRHDEDDPYLVVAADKGTATFSDIANSISQEYNFWMSDAFASGGSNGYDHKKMGITAKGAWESVKRHFKEFGIDCQSVDFSCIGVGDMGGDVFGNGMLLSKHICLKAAFNHMHIFMDPSPDAEASWHERQRLFELPGSLWTDYNASLISKGGGVFERSAKSIKLNEALKKMLHTDKNSLTPNEVVRHILKMPADLLWNGGIGTYFKSTKETHLDVGDRANDAVRINAKELNVEVLGEGGNLGCTQLGRIEFAMQRGRINTDFIDNVGGVDCSDNEVNIKILLNGLVDSGDLTMKQRNQLLVDMTEEVSEIVLKDCRNQTQAISISESFGVAQLKEQIRFIHHLEKEGKLIRYLEFLPNDEELAERIASGLSLTRPELSVLFSYAKMVLKEQLNCPEITTNTYFIDNLLIGYFPKRLQQKYQAQIKQHALSGEIIATSLANQMINDMGMNFVYRTHEETGAPVHEIGICYVIGRDIFDIPSIVAELTKAESTVTAETQYEILYKLRRNTRRATYWLLRHRDRSISIDESVAKYRETFMTLKKDISSWLMDEEVNATAEQVYRYEQDGVDQNIAFPIANLGRLFSALDITEISHETKHSIVVVAELYFKLRAKCQLYWFLEQINAQDVNNHWQALARSAFREELDWHQRALTNVVLKDVDGIAKADEMIDQWMERNHQALSRWNHILADFKISNTHEFAKFSVVLRELNLLVLHCVGQLKMT
ncbi:MAG: NAD-glutamate dehydrogenase [Shewanellaceae bacterium]|nr:NAD-glutamate dehydrogenase [Shewanellaceae bacterium]